MQEKFVASFNKTGPVFLEKKMKAAIYDT